MSEYERLRRAQWRAAMDDQSGTTDWWIAQEFTKMMHDGHTDEEYAALCALIDQ